MKKIKQGFALSVFILTGCASTEVKNEQSTVPYLTDAQIKTLIVGKTMSDVGKSWSQTMNIDGTMTGSSGSGTESGSYTIKDGKYCSKWKFKRDGSTACWAIQKRTNYYYGKLVSGSSRSFKFTVQ